MLSPTINTKDWNSWYFMKRRTFVDQHAAGFTGKHFEKRFLQWCKRMVRTSA